MKNRTTLIIVALATALSLVAVVTYFKNQNTPPINDLNITFSNQVIYNNVEYGFNFILPTEWQGYSIIKESWKGTALTGTTTKSGPKLIIRNPKWATSTPYEDLPILVFTISEWNAYMAEEFSVSAAPIKASELSRNNMYVFALPARWDFDYSLEYKEAQDIMAKGPLHAFDVRVSQGKLNVDFICEQALSYMQFVDSRSADEFVVDCKEGRHPEVIEKYKADMNLGDGAKI